MSMTFEALIETLQARFDRFPERHSGVDWKGVRERLNDNPGKLTTLAAMESTGGEPDVIGKDDTAVIFADCAPESPIGRRSLCFDQSALDQRKANKPQGSAIALASEMGAALLTEPEYRALQLLGEFDLKTSSWVQTPGDIRARGGALFCDRRYGRVFTYHNGADSYYASRGFRTRLVV